MESFDLKEHLTPFYDVFPEAPHRPVIGVTANFNDGMATMERAYYQQVADAGGVPVIIPPLSSQEAIINTLEHLDGLLLTGGADINPLWAGEEPIAQLHRINATRDARDYKSQNMKVRKGDHMHLHLAPGGGCVAKLTAAGW